jgi:predicted nuclease of predicted toxin-antitoxin system
VSRYFFDECLSRKVAEALRVLGVDVIHLRDEWGEGVKDVDWIARIKREGRIVITQDGAMRRKDAERVALRESPVVFVFMNSALTKMDGLKQAGWLLTHWEDIEHGVAKARTGDCFEVTQNGKIKAVEKQ